MTQRLAFTLGADMGLVPGDQDFAATTAVHAATTYLMAAALVLLTAAHGVFKAILTVAVCGSSSVCPLFMTVTLASVTDSKAAILSCSPGD